MPCYKIYEDQEYLAFLDVFPYVPGHTLLIPKKHVRWVWDAPDVGGYFVVAQKIVKHFQTITGNEFVIEATFGDAVSHAHVHLLPDTLNDPSRLIKTFKTAPDGVKAEPTELLAMQQKFSIV